MLLEPVDDLGELGDLLRARRIAAHHHAFGTRLVELLERREPSSVRRFDGDVVDHREIERVVRAAVARRNAPGARGHGAASEGLGAGPLPILAGDDVDAGHAVEVVAAGEDAVAADVEARAARNAAAAVVHLEQADGRVRKDRRVGHACEPLFLRLAECVRLTGEGGRGIGRVVERRDDLLRARQRNALQAEAQSRRGRPHAKVDELVLPSAQRVRGMRVDVGLHVDVEREIGGEGRSQFVVNESFQHGTAERLVPVAYRLHRRFERRVLGIEIGLRSGEYRLQREPDEVHRRAGSSGSEAEHAEAPVHHAEHHVPLVLLIGQAFGGVARSLLYRRVDPRHEHAEPLAQERHCARHGDRFAGHGRIANVGDDRRIERGREPILDQIEDVESRCSGHRQNGPADRDSSRCPTAVRSQSVRCHFANRASTARCRRVC